MYEIKFETHNHELIWCKNLTILVENVYVGRMMSRLVLQGWTSSSKTSIGATI